VLQTNSPNKFFDAIAAGVSCITNIKGWIADEIAAAECGFYTDPAQPQQTFEQINLLVQNPDLYKLARKKARHLAENKFSKKQATQKFVALFSVPQRNQK
jgi:glycosyltransferase involved in cell wall biosynthesis